MIERVRAVLVTPGGCMLAVRRDRPGQSAYWVLPGGQADPEDQSREAALSRESARRLPGSRTSSACYAFWALAPAISASTPTLAGSRPGHSQPVPGRNSARPAAAPTNWSRSP